MLTDRGRVLAVASLGLWLSSRLLGADELGMAAAVLFLLLVVSVAYTRVSSARLHVTRRVTPPRLFFGAVGTVTVDVRNLGSTRTAVLRVIDDTPPALGPQGDFLLPPQRAEHYVALRYRIQGQIRGRHRFVALKVQLRDPFGIARRDIEFAQPDEVVVYPRIDVLGSGVRFQADEATTTGRPRPLSTGDELATVREYVRGDDLRKVHWRSTAHRGQLMIRQDEAQVQQVVTLVADARGRAHRGHGARDSFEAGLSATASIAHHLARGGFRIRLLTGPFAVPPDPMPWLMAMDVLAELEPSTLDSLSGLWRQVGGGHAGSGALIAVITPPSMAELGQMVRAGRRFRSRLAIVIETETFGGRSVRLRPSSDGEAEPGSSQQALFGLASAGWRVTRLRAGDSLPDRWHELSATAHGILGHRRSA